MNNADVRRLLDGPTSEHFWLRRDGALEIGDASSRYGYVDDELSFDISNGRALGNVAGNGSLRSLTFYRGDHPADDIPGVWRHKDLTTSGPYAFAVTTDERVRIDLAEVTDGLHTRLLGNAVPSTVVRLGSLRLTTVTFAPISADGSQRPAAVVHGLLVDNDGEHTVRGSIALPRTHFGAENFDRLAAVLAADGLPQQDEHDFTVAPGESRWFAVDLCAIPEAESHAQLGARDSVSWLAETLEYYRNATGKLAVAGDPFVGEFLQRAVHQCLHSLGVAANGELVGSNWGSAPATTRVWMKDLYYSLLPLAMFDPAMLEKGILWLTRHSVRPSYVAGPRTFAGCDVPGGLHHSLSNALAPAALAGIYHHFADGHRFFTEHGEVLTTAQELLDQLVGTGELFESQWISDGRSYGDFHTGTNVVVWYALRSMATILDDLGRDAGAVERYRKAADELRAALDRRNIVTVDGERIYCEGSFRDGPPVIGHDGEESDVTLMPFYGYCSGDDPVYTASMRFAGTSANPWYVKETGGILWADNVLGDQATIHTDSTFPGYTTILAGARTPEEFAAAFGQIRELTDLDGSLWWWPYPHGGPYERPARHVGKCGWASGVFAAMYVTGVLGLDYSAPTRRLRIRPTPLAAAYRWHGARLGAARFDIELDLSRRRLAVTNRGPDEIVVDWQLPGGEPAQRPLAGGAQLIAGGE